MSEATYTHFIAVGNNNGWGRDETEAIALRNMHNSGRMKADEFIVYRTGPGAYVNDMGGLNYPKDDPKPEVLKHVKPAKRAGGAK